MKLINEIIAILSSEKPNLTNALIKTKVLLYKIEQKSLVGWVNNELNGYQNSDDIPPYRILPSQVLVNASNMAYQVNAHPIPLAHLDDDIRESLETFELSQSLAVLEEFANSGSDSLERPLPMEWIPLLNKGLSNNYRIQKAWCQISVTGIIQILTEVRSRLLDFLLELSSEFGEEMTDEQVKNKANNVDSASMFNSAMFGDNTTILVGNQNTQHVVNSKVLNNFSELEKELKKHGVVDDDISELKLAIDNDAEKVDFSSKSYGPAVNSWFKKMIGKAVDGTWQINLGVAGNIISGLLNGYYGWY
ncbi:MAG: response regulator receiver protein [Cellvibrio sp.]|uniref:AbiTii domain-containing protein n=1 Tax=Cellvibrio sp. TaxID=1965322 RepID=UPI0031B38D42